MILQVSPREGAALEKSWPESNSAAKSINEAMRTLRSFFEPGFPTRFGMGETW